MTEAKQPDKAPAPEAQVAPVQQGHKNPPVGPKTGKPVAEWNQFRDYEQFNPTAEK